MIFLPWKTAGSTMFIRMAHYNQSPYSRFFYFNSYLKRIVHQHITVADFKAMHENTLDLQKIAFIRNPYDRVYSGFFQIQKDIKQQPLMPFPEPWIKNHVLKQLSINEGKLVRAHYDFNKWVALLEPEEIFDIGCNSSLPLHPAHYWTHDHENKFVQFIGKVEAFENDFAKMLQFLQISEHNNFENDNVELFPDNKADSDYKYIERMSKDSIDKINYLFEKDFKLFGYKTC